MRLSDNDYCPYLSESLFEFDSGWEVICNYMKNEESLSTFQLFVTKLDQLGNFRFVEDLVENPLEWSLIHPEHSDFVKLLLRSPVAHELNFQYALVHVAHYPSGYDNIELLLKYSDKVNIDVNFVDYHLEFYGMNALHCIAIEEDGEQAVRYLKIMIANADKCGINVHAKNEDGKTPFYLMCMNGAYGCAKNKLDCWLDYPEFFTYSIFKDIEIKALVNLMLELYEEKLKSGETTNELDQKLNLPKWHCRHYKHIIERKFLLYELEFLNSYRTNTKEDRTKKKVLVETILEIYHERIKAHEMAKKSEYV